MVEHKERAQEEGRISFPGEVVMPQGLIPVAMWLGTREYVGIWRHGGGEGRFCNLEIFRALGDGHNTALFEVLAVYGTRVDCELTWHLMWYCDNFVDWATEILHHSNLLICTRHNLEDKVNWCGSLSCPYPYALKIVPPNPALTLPKHILVIEAEDPVPWLSNLRLMNPCWGAYLHVKILKKEVDLDKETPMDREMALGN